MQNSTTHTAALDVLVIGGGQSGLALAWHLARSGLDAGPETGHVW